MAGLDRIKKFSVIDVETTGLYDRDRICEIAIVDLNPDTFEIVEQFDTLINPNRDVGPTHIHQITPTMVVDAPLFEDIAGEIANRLNGSVLVGHNVSFDKRMIANEFDKLGADLNLGNSQCTLSMARKNLKLRSYKLFLVAEELKIKYKNHHKALYDAIVTAQIFKQLNDGVEIGDIEPVVVESSKLRNTGRPLPRDKVAATKSDEKESLIQQKIKYLARYPTSNEGMLSYLEYLDLALYDLKLSEDENEHLQDLAESSGLSGEDIVSAKKMYMSVLVDGAKDDGIITSRENQIMHSVADMLGLVSEDIPEITDQCEYPKGTRVCFTGAAVDQNKKEISRGLLKAEAEKKGFQVVALTKSGCDLLVASDTNTASGKAKKARQYGIKIVSVQDFIEEVGIF